MRVCGCERVTVILTSSAATRKDEERRACSVHAHGRSSRFPVVWIAGRVTSREPTPSRLCSGTAEIASFPVNAHRIPQPWQSSAGEERRPCLSETALSALLLLLKRHLPSCPGSSVLLRPPNTKAALLCHHCGDGADGSRLIMAGVLITP